MRYVAWPHIGGSNAMTRGLAWKSVTDKLDRIPVVYTQLDKHHCVAMSEQDFTLFALKWDHQNLGFLKWQIANPPYEQE